MTDLTLPLTIVCGPDIEAVRFWCRELGIHRRAQGTIIAVQPEALYGVEIVAPDRLVVLPGTPFAVGQHLTICLDDADEVQAVMALWPKFYHGEKAYIPPNSVGLYDVTVGCVHL